MKRQTTQQYRRLALALVVAAILGASAALAQTGGGYDLTWSTIDGGGGSSAGGGYQLAGHRYVGQDGSEMPGIGLVAEEDLSQLSRAVELLAARQHALHARTG